MALLAWFITRGHHPQNTAHQSALPLCLCQASDEDVGWDCSGGVLAIDCEFVGMRADDGSNSQYDALCEIALVNRAGTVVYNTFVDPGPGVADYRKRIHGITRKEMQGAPYLEDIQQELEEYIDGALIVGLGTWNVSACDSACPGRAQGPEGWAARSS